MIPAQFSPDKQQVVTASASMGGVGASQECGAMIGPRNIPVPAFSFLYRREREQSRMDLGMRFSRGLSRTDGSRLQILGEFIWQVVTERSPLLKLYA